MWGDSVSTSTSNDQTQPKQTLSLFDVIMIIVGIVIGSGIFKLPGMVADNSASEQIFILTWLAGGIISIIGVLCYAELASTYPNAGGDYFSSTAPTEGECPSSSHGPGCRSSRRAPLLS
jgi:APA family basic amino acid/polyamine antiporter